MATWTTSNTSVATVTSTGRLQAITPGTVTMSAKSDAVVGAATLTVTLVRVGRITVLPTTTVLFTGRTLPLVVQLADSLGNPLSTTGRTVTWASAVPAIATVDAIGVATTITPGTVAISATSDGKSASAILTVNAMPVSSVSVRPDTALLSTGNVVQLTATAFDAGGSVIPGRLATWSLSDATVASVDATGQVSGLAPGAVRVTATIDGMQGSATVVVSAIPVSSVTISPPTPTLTVGSTLALSATLYGPAPNVVLSPVGRTVTWSVASGGVASISGAGVVTALSAGTTTVTVSAVSPGQLSPVTATVSLTVTP